MRSVFAILLLVLQPSGLLSQSAAGQDVKAPEFALEALNGRTIRLSDYTGNVVPLNFWAT